MRLPKVVWILLIVTTLGGVFAVAQQSGWGPENFGLVAQVADDRLFVPGALQQDEARKLYRASLEALSDADDAVAVAGFEKLQKVYPGLEELIALHLGEAKSDESNELGAQTVLKNALRRHPQSALSALLAYRLAQSHYRASEWKEARENFARVQKQHPQSAYGTGSLYFLGLLELKENAPDKNKVIAHWRQYLDRCPDCTYSADISERLDPMIPAPQTADDHRLLGTGYASGERDGSKALAHLRKAPLKTAWLPLSKTLLKEGFRAEAVETVIKGLPHATDRKIVMQAMDEVLLKACTSCVPTLKEIDALAIPVGGDYVLWKLSQMNAAQAQTYYQQIVSRYPTGDYAPESSWNLIWPLLKAGNAEAFLAKAQTHLVKYGYSRSAPKALFWTGKTLEKTDREEALHAYQRILKSYPNDYYAYRAWGRLEYFKTGHDPGWTLTVRQPGYPPKLVLEDLNVISAEAEFVAASAAGGKRAYAAALELQKIGAADDLKLLVEEALGKVPAPVESWVMHQKGDKLRAIRMIRDAIAERSMPQNISETKNPETENQETDNQERPDSTTPQLPTKDELKLLYPVYYADIIATEAPAKGVDPYLAQSLMREESYFNAAAVSTSNALGLMQLLPSTAKEVAGWEKLSGFQPPMLFDPAVNIRLGTRYLKYLLETFGGNALPMVGAYNGGPNAMKRWINESAYFDSDPDMFVELIPYEQTRDYIKKVYGSYWNYNRLYTPTRNSDLQ